MNLQINNTEQDYLEFLMYNSSISESELKKRKRTKIFVPILYTILGIFIFVSSNKFFGIAFMLFGIGWFFLSRKVLKGKYEKTYRKFIKEAYEKRINANVALGFDDEFIYTKDDTAESKIKIAEIDRIVELKNLMLVYISKASAIVIPKRQIPSQQEFEDFFKQKRIPFIDEMTWEWK